MNSLDDIIFIDSLPKIDLHGFDRESARLYINDFINDNIKIKNNIFAIIHGNGTGILRKTTIETLRKNKNVLEFKQYYYNTGSTVVRIKI